MRQRAFSAFGLVTTALLCLAGVARSGTVRRPNVLLIITDDHGYGDLGVHGNERIRTPNLDRLAREGFQLTQFHVSPVCAPTRASLMTGRYNYRTGAVDTFLGRAMMYPDEVTAAEILGGAGYRTGIFGKWHLGDNYPLRAMDQGFQEALVHTGGGIGQPSDPPGNTYFDPILQHNGKAEHYRGYCTDIFTDAALQFIETNRNRPFFAYLATNAPHGPLQVADELVLPYSSLGLDDTTARIYAMVSNIDQNVGRLLRRLDDLRLAQDTLVIFMTDNGPQQARYNAGMRGLKGTVYEGGIRVPCFVRWPARVRSGGSSDPIAAHIDILPTLIDACGVLPPAGVAFDGRSLMPLLTGPSSAGLQAGEDRKLFFQWHRGDQPEPFRSAAVRTQRYKLVDGTELYDLEADPGEQRNVAREHPEVVIELRTAYREWFRDVSATRGYDPPRIHLGTSHQNPVTLTRQDWRGPRAGWAADSLGYWEVQVARGGVFRITLRIAPPGTDGTAHLKVGDVMRDVPVAAGAASAVFDRVRLPSGPARLEAWIATHYILAVPLQTVGAQYVDVARK